MCVCGGGGGGGKDWARFTLTSNGQEGLGERILWMYKPGLK